MSMVRQTMLYKKDETEVVANRGLGPARKNNTVAKEDDTKTCFPLSWFVPPSDSRTFMIQATQNVNP